MSKLVEINLNPDKKTLRQFGVIAFVGFGILGALAYYEKLIFSFGLGEARSTVVTIFAALGSIALLFSLSLPATLPLWQTALGCAVGVLIGKEIFGGFGYNFVNPVVVGLAFLYFWAGGGDGTSPFTYNVF